MAFVARSRNPWRSVSYPKIIIEVSCLRKEMSKKICEVEWRSPAPRRLVLSGPRAPRQHMTQPSYPHMRIVLTFAVRLGPRAPCFAQARPCFAHAGAASPQAARRNSPTPPSSTVGPSVTIPPGRARTGAPITNDRREKQAARRLRVLRLHSVRRLCSNRHCWARRPWIFDGTGDTLSSAVRRRHTRRGAGCAAPLDASSKRRVGAIAGQRQCPRTATNRCARRSSALLVAVSPIRPGHSARRGIC